MMDGIETDCGVVESAVDAGAAVACPNNACSGFAVNGTYVQFVAGAGGAQGYVPLSSLFQMTEVNGQFLTEDQYQNYLAQTYKSQIASQYARVSGNLAALFGGAAAADQNDPNVIGGHANFDLTCSDMSVCGPGRYDFGVHIEYDQSGNLVVHDDTVSPWTGDFSISSVFTGSFWEHGLVDLAGGSLCGCVFPH